MQAPIAFSFKALVALQQHELHMLLQQLLFFSATGHTLSLEHVNSAACLQLFQCFDLWVSRGKKNA